ncbi:hypothetical protein [Catenulispora rubra]|uniref:hypothetical protein n=1 Tax=Catenulispora rubra TaxID=280293 RepID=UPI0018920973|nr:hypothetical protein [Catenulispora rubra]
MAGTTPPARQLPDEITLTADLVARAIRADPEHPLVREALDHVAFEKALIAAQLATQVDRIAVAAQVLATLAAFHTAGLGNGHDDDGSWRASAAAIVEVARGNDTSYLRGVAESALNACPAVRPTC